MGGEIEEIGVRLATKLGEKGIKSEINLKKRKKKKKKSNTAFEKEKTLYRDGCIAQPSVEGEAFPPRLLTGGARRGRWAFQAD